MPSSLRLLGVALLAVACAAPLNTARTLASTDEPTCNAIGAACCPGNATDTPPEVPKDVAGNKIAWCRGDNLTCMRGKSWQDPATCQAYPLVGCGQTGQPCCPPRYHNPQPSNKQLGPQCVVENDYCAGSQGCKTNAPDCGTLGNKACIGPNSEVAQQLICKGDDLGVEFYKRDSVCIKCERQDKYSVWCKK